MSNQSSNKTVATILLSALTSVIVTVATFLVMAEGFDKEPLQESLKESLPQFTQKFLVQEGDEMVVPLKHSAVLHGAVNYGKRFNGEDICLFYMGDTIVLKGKTDTDLVFQITNGGNRSDKRSCKDGEHISLTYEEFETMLFHKKKEAEIAHRAEQLKAKFKEVADIRR